MSRIWNFGDPTAAEMIYSKGRETSLEKWSSSRLIVSLWRARADQRTELLLLAQPTIDPFPAALPNEQQWDGLNKNQSEKYSLLMDEPSPLFHVFTLF